MIVGLDPGPGVEAIETSTDRKPWDVEGCELVTFLRRLGTSDRQRSLVTSVGRGLCAWSVAAAEVDVDGLVDKVGFLGAVLSDAECDVSELVAQCSDLDVVGFGVDEAADRLQVGIDVTLLGSKDVDPPGEAWLIGRIRRVSRRRVGWSQMLIGGLRSGVGGCQLQCGASIRCEGLLVDVDQAAVFDDHSSVDDDGSDVGGACVESERGDGVVGAEVMECVGVHQDEIGDLADGDTSELAGTPEARSSLGGHR